MSSQQQWVDAYELAEQMYNSHAPKRRAELDLFAELVCARYDSVFKYDPYKDEYSFRDQALSFQSPVLPRLRRIAEVDLTALKNNTVETKLDTPCYMDMTPVYGVAPSTILVFSNSQPRVFGLTKALEAASKTIKHRPTEVELRPGAEFLYKHRDDRLFRVMILKEHGGEYTCDEERRYEVAFMDVCQVITLKLKHLYLPTEELSLKSFPCALFCARFNGIALIRKGYLDTWDADIKKVYNEKHKVGLTGVVYKIDVNDCKLLIDFPSFVKMECTEVDYLKTVHGHHSLETRDPIKYSFADIKERKILPLQYEEPEEEEDDEIELSLNSSSASVHPAVQNSECPLGMNSINNFFKQAIPVSAVEAIKSEKVKEIEKEQPSVPLPKTEIFGNQKPLRAPQRVSPNVTDISVNLDISSNSILIPSSRSDTTTPLPTYDIPAERGYQTPTKKSEASSTDGWDAPTPQKKKEIDGWESPERPVTSIQRPLSELFNGSKSTEKPTLKIAPRKLETPDDLIPEPIHLSPEPLPTIEDAPIIQTKHEVRPEDVVIACEEYNSPMGTPTKFNTTIIEHQNWGEASEVREENDDVFATPENTIPQHQSLLIPEAQAHFHDDSDNEDAPKGAESELENELERENLVTAVDVSSVDSVKSVCPTDCQEFFEDEPSTPLFDEFALVSESSKKLADAFFDSVQVSVSQKNRQSFNTDIFIMDAIALKSSGDLEQRFWKSKVQKARALEPSFD